MPPYSTRHVTGRTFAAVLCLTAAMVLGGCRHKQAAPTLPAVLKAPDTPPPAPAEPKMKAPPPETVSTASPVKVTEAKPKPRARKKPSNPSIAQAMTPVVPGTVAQPTPEVAASAGNAVAGSPLGELSAGGESNPRNQQEAGDLVSSGERRFEALLKTKAGQQEAQTREVRHFLQEARQALTTGDAEGAKTLATKAKLLMDDLEKWAAQ